MSLPTTTKWQQEIPPWSTTLGLWHVYTKKRRSSRRARVQEELNVPVWERKSQGWRYHDEPSHNYKMTVKSAIMIHYLGLRHVYNENRRSSRGTRVQQELNMIHYPRAAACIFTRGRNSQVTSSRHIVMYLLAKNLMKLLYICTCVFLIYDVLEYVYHSACDKIFSYIPTLYSAKSSYIPTLYSANTYSVSTYLN